MKLKIFVSSIMTAMFASATFANLPYQLKEGMPYEGKTVKVMVVVTPQFKGIELRTDEFTKLTGIKVEWTAIPFASLQEKVASVGVAANGNFDVVNYLDSWGPSYAHWLLPIDDHLKRDGISMDRYPAAFAKSASYQGQTLGFPLRAHPQLMFYRKDIFQELNLQPPKTWKDVVAAGKKIKAEKGIGGFACYYGADGNKQNLFVWLNFLWANDAKIFDKGMKPSWDSAKAIQATKDYVAMHTDHKICGAGATSNTEQEARLQFQQGKAAMVPVWWWAYSGFSNPKVSVLKKSQVAFTGMPSYNGKVVTYAISMPFAISKYSKNPDAAWEFMKWLSNPDLDKRNAIEREVKGVKIMNNVVTHKSSLVDKEVNAANESIQLAASESLKDSNIMPQIAEWPEVGDLISNAIQSAANGADVEKVMKDSAKKAKRILKRAGYYK